MNAPSKVPSTEERPAEAGSDAGLAPIYDENNYNLQTSVGYRMKRLVASMSNRIEQTLQSESVALTNSQWAPLMILSRGQVNTICQLAREFDIDVGAMTRMVDRLESKGLCVRVRSTKDRRVVEVQLTAAGRAAIEHVPPVIIQVLNQYLAGFTGDEWNTLLKLLDRMHANGLALEQAGAAQTKTPS